MNLSPSDRVAARATMLQLVEQLRLATLHYDAATDRLAAAGVGTTEARTWQRHTTRWRNECALLAARLNRARATAEGRPWLRAL